MPGLDWTPHYLAALDIQHSHRPNPGPAHHTLTIWTPAHRPHIPRVSGPFANDFSRLDVPHSHFAIGASTSNCLAVWRQCYGGHSCLILIISPVVTYLCAALQVT